MSTSSVSSSACASCGTFAGKCSTSPAHHDLVGLLADEELQRAFQDVGELLVVVRVLRDDTTLLEVHVRQHDLVAGDQATRQPLVQFLAGDLVPAIPFCRSFTAHCDAPSWSPPTTLPRGRFGVKTGWRPWRDIDSVIVHDAT